MTSKKHKLHKTMTEHSTRADIRRKQPIFPSNSHTSNSHMMSVRVIDESDSQLPNDFGHRAQAHQPNESRIGFNNSLTRRNKRIKMSNYHVDHCNQDFWSETINDANPHELLMRKWSFNEKVDYENKTVSFRWVALALASNRRTQTIHRQTIFHSFLPFIEFSIGKRTATTCTKWWKHSIYAKVNTLIFPSHSNTLKPLFNFHSPPFTT